jgi:hypothetical protein
MAIFVFRKAAKHLGHGRFRVGVLAGERAVAHEGKSIPVCSGAERGLAASIIGEWLVGGDGCISCNTVTTVRGMTGRAAGTTGPSNTQDHGEIKGYVVHNRQPGRYV